MISSKPSSPFYALALQFFGGSDRSQTSTSPPKPPSTLATTHLVYDVILPHNNTDNLSKEM